MLTLNSASHQDITIIIVSLKTMLIGVHKTTGENICKYLLCMLKQGEIISTGSRNLGFPMDVFCSTTSLKQTTKLRRILGKNM